MPNFRGERTGLITRIGIAPGPHAARYGTVLKDIHVEALPLAYDPDRWLADFLANWPQGSAAHTSYYRRICAGTDFTRQRARTPDRY